MEANIKNELILTYAQQSILEKISRKIENAYCQDFHWDESTEYDVYGDLSW